MGKEKKLKTVIPEKPHFQNVKLVVYRKHKREDKPDVTVETATGKYECKNGNWKMSEQHKKYLQGEP